MNDASSQRTSLGSIPSSGWAPGVGSTGRESADVSMGAIGAGVAHLDVTMEEVAV